MEILNEYRQPTDMILWRKSIYLAKKQNKNHSKEYQKSEAFNIYQNKGGSFMEIKKPKAKEKKIKIDEGGVMDAVQGGLDALSWRYPAASMISAAVSFGKSLFAKTEEEKENERAQAIRMGAYGIMSSLPEQVKRWDVVISEWKKQTNQL